MLAAQERSRAAGLLSGEPQVLTQGGLLFVGSNAFAIDSALIKSGMARSATVDANNFLYTVKAYQLFSVVADIPKFKAETLLIPVASDKLFPPEFSQRAAEQLRAAGKYAEVFVIPGDGGHLDGVTRVVLADQAIRKLLQRPDAF